MTKIKSLLLAVIGLLCATGVSAHDFEVDGICYNITSSIEKTVAVTNYVEDFNFPTPVYIPEIVSYNQNLYHVTSIGDNAFSGCSNLTSVYIPSSVTSIGNGAFSGCDLTSLVVAADNPVYDSRGGCNAIIESTSNTLIAGCKTTIIPNSVTSIGDDAFSGCSNLTSVYIPSSVTSIGNGAFSGCDLTSLVVAADNPVYDSRGGCNAIIESTSNTLIAGCKTTIIPNSVTSIGDYAFGYCDGLTSVEIPNSVTCIGNSAFEECRNLTSVDIPNSVAKIGKRAFWDCFDLTSVVIPNSVTNIECDAFAGCTNLINITVADDNQIYDSREHCNAIIECDTNTLIIGCKTSTIPNSVVHIGKWAFAGCSRLSSVNIPNSVTSIGDYAFGYCYDLSSVNIPNSVTCIGNSAFEECWYLTSVDIPNSVTKIGKRAFYDCYRLTSVEIPNSVTNIGDSTFRYCFYLTSVVIPKSVTNIGDYAFSDCSNLRSVISDVPAEILFPISDNVFDEGHKTICILYVPHGAKETYASTPGWQNFMNIVEMSEDGTTDIDKVQTELGRGNAIYDLYGRKLNHVSRSGFYILNGKKVWVK